MAPAEVVWNDTTPPVEVISIPKASKGRVIRHTKRAQFDLLSGTSRGGRVVRTMPRNLVEIQDAQSLVEDDLPRVEDD